MQITETVVLGMQITEFYLGNCLGMLSHQLKRNVIDGEKAIIQNPTEQHRLVNQVPDQLPTSHFNL